MCHFCNSKNCRHDTNLYNSIHPANCEVPLVNRNVKLNYNSTLEGSVSVLTCGNEISSMHMNTTNDQVLHVTCHSSGNWIPDPANFTCVLFTTSAVPPGI